MKHTNENNKGGLIMFAATVAGFYLAWRFARDVKTRARNQRLQRGKRIVILGAGFGGREVALELAKQLPRPEDGEILLVDQEPFLLFTPMLTEAAGGELDPDHIVSPVTRLPKRINYIQGRVEAIDLHRRSVTLEIGHREANIPQAKRTLVADHLVLALGAVSNFRHIPGLEEHDLTIKSLDDAAAVRNRALQLLQRANAEPDPGQRRELLTFVVGGAGLTGVETIAAINDLLRESARKFPHLKADDIRTILVDPGPRIMPELSKELAQFAAVELQRHGVEIRLNTKVTSAGEDYAELNGTERIATRTVIWAGGITPNPIIKELDCRHSRHGFEFKGAIAWAMWRLIYWSKMPSLPQRMRILSDWVLDLLFGRNLAPLPPVAQLHQATTKPAIAATQ